MLISYATLGYLISCSHSFIWKATLTFFCKCSSMCVPCVESMNVACVTGSPCIVRTTGIYRRFRVSAMQAAMNVKWQKWPIFDIWRAGLFCAWALDQPWRYGSSENFKANCALVKNMQLNDRKIPFGVWTVTKTQRKPCRHGNRDGSPVSGHDKCLRLAWVLRKRKELAWFKDNSVCGNQKMNIVIQPNLIILFLNM